MSDDGILHFNPWMDFNDRPPSENPFGCDPDPEQIAVFLDTVFSWCEGLIPLRGFVDKGQGRDGKPHNIWIPADDTAPEKLATFAAWANREGAAVYVIPGTVKEQGQARAADVLQMQAIVVDLDAGDAGQPLEMCVAGKERRALCAGGCEDDRVGSRELVLPARLRRRQRDLGVERHHMADLREGDDLIGFVLADLACQPFRQLELDHGRYEPLGLFGQMFRQLLAGRRADEPLDPRRRVDEDHQNRSVRSR